MSAQNKRYGQTTPQKDSFKETVSLPMRRD